MRLALLGGTFDPVHLGHLLLAEVARDQLRLDRVLFVPAGDPPHKQEKLKSAACHRRAMTGLAIAANECFELSPVDLERPGPHYSTDTVRLIRSSYGVSGEDCFFAIGADSLEDLPTWHRPDELIRLCRLAIAPRPDYRPDMAALERLLPGLSARLDWLHMPALGISSTDIRLRARQGRTIRYLVPESVRQYIEQYGLYRGDGEV